jgi:hypothetical protein
MLFEYHDYMETKLAKRNSLGVSVHGDFDAGTGREAAGGGVGSKVPFASWQVRR